MLKLIGKKIAMTQYYKGYKVIPVTIVDVTDNVVAGKLTDGDSRFLLIGFGREKHPTKPELGQFKELGYVPYKLVAVRVTEQVYNDFKIGDTVTEGVLKQYYALGAKVDVTGFSKGKGFAGVIKRYGFSRQPKTHGQSDRERHTGSIGAQTPGRVLKGKRMPGRMGNHKVTVKNLEVIDYVNKDNRLFVILKGSVPGGYKELVILRSLAQ